MDQKIRNITRPLISIANFVSHKTTNLLSSQSSSSPSSTSSYNQKVIKRSILRKCNAAVPVQLHSKSKRFKLQPPLSRHKSNWQQQIRRIFTLKMLFGSCAAILLLGGTFLVITITTAKEVDLGTTKIIFHFGPTYENSITFELGEIEKFLKDSHYDANKATTLYMHGYMEKPTSRSVREIIDSYNIRGNHNLLVLDWKTLASDSYIQSAFFNIKILGEKLADIILEAFNSGLDRKSFHCVGHSLGAQLAGILGRQVIEKSNGKVKLNRITALDPAFPGFFNIILAKSVSKTDAGFVDIIHTDAGFYGSPFILGTADFWPNGGTAIQPGCPPRDYVLLSDDDLCSHWRSWKFWAETVASGKDQKRMWAYPTKSWRDFQLHGAEDVKRLAVTMGIDCPLSASGNYYLRTNSDPPFAKG